MLDHFNYTVRVPMSDINGDIFRCISFQATDKIIFIIFNTNRNRGNQAFFMHSFNKWLAPFFIKTMHNIKIPTSSKLFRNRLINNRLHIRRYNWQAEGVITKLHSCICLRSTFNHTFCWDELDIFIIKNLKII